MEKSTTGAITSGSGVGSSDSDEQENSTNMDNNPTKVSLVSLIEAFNNT